MPEAPDPIKLKKPKRGWATFHVDFSPWVGRRRWRLRLALLFFRVGAWLLRANVDAKPTGRRKWLCEACERVYHADAADPGDTCHKCGGPLLAVSLCVDADHYKEGRP